MGCGVEKSQITRGTGDVLLGEARRRLGHHRARVDARPVAHAVEPGPDRRRSPPANYHGGPRAQAAQRAQAHLRPVRSHPHRLPAGAQHADAERAGRGAERADPDAVRVLRARRALGAGRHHRADQGVGESGARDRRHPAHDVRSAKQPLQRSVEPAHRAFRRQGVPHHRAAQRAARRGAVLRQTGPAARQGLARRAGLPGAGRRDAAQGRRRGGQRSRRSRRRDGEAGTPDRHGD